MADFDGDGKSDFGIYTPSATVSSWDVLLSGSNYTTHLHEALWQHSRCAVASAPVIVELA